MNGRTIITSKQQGPYLYAWEKYRNTARVSVRADNILWEFTSEDEAIRAARLFMNLGFEYVQRK